MESVKNQTLADQLFERALSEAGIFEHLGLPRPKATRWQVLKWRLKYWLEMHTPHFHLGPCDSGDDYDD